MAPIRCRAQVSEACCDGKIDEARIYDSGVMSEDGTWNGTTVVCDACYIAIGQPRLEDLDAAISEARGE